MKLKGIDPKAFFDFFSKVEPDKAVLLVKERTGLYVEQSEDTDTPESTVKSFRVRREDLLVFIRLIGALMGGRPVKLTPDTKAYWKVHIGPR